MCFDLRVLPHKTFTQVTFQAYSRQYHTRCPTWFNLTFGVIGRTNLGVKSRCVSN